MDLFQLTKELGLPLAMAILGVWGFVTGRVVTAKSYQAMVEASVAEKADMRAAFLREIDGLKEIHAREMADRDKRLEAAHITETRLIEIALRSTQAGEKAAELAVTRGKA